MDFNKMITDVIKGKEKEDKYVRENDAKFRAVEQRVQTYNEFEAIVKGCHLRPLDKKESISSLLSIGPAWNATACNDPASMGSLEKEVDKYFNTVGGFIAKGACYNLLGQHNQHSS